MFVVSETIESSDVAMCSSRAKQSFQMNSNVLRSCNETEFDRPCMCALLGIFISVENLVCIFLPPQQLALWQFSTQWNLSIFCSHMKGGTTAHVTKYFPDMIEWNIVKKILFTSIGHTTSVHGWLPVAFNCYSGRTKMGKRKHGKLVRTIHALMNIQTNMISKHNLLWIFTEATDQFDFAESINVQCAPAATKK